MAKSKHLKLLNQGVTVWNNWHKDSWSILSLFASLVPPIFSDDDDDDNFSAIVWYNSHGDLSGAYLENRDLYGINFNSSNLEKVNLNYAKLKNADIGVAFARGASFIGADLTNANFSDAKLIDADFTNANLTNANFSNAKLIGADFTNSNLTSAQLNSIKYDDTTKLCGSNLSYVSLKSLTFNKFDFSQCCLQGANLRGVDLRNANLTEADLTEADLSHADLRDANLKNADITGACLYASITFRWNIESILCRHIYLDKGREKRQPKDHDFELGEFERLYRVISTIEFVFENGMTWIDPLLINEAAARVSGESTELDLRLISVDLKGSSPKAVFEINSKELEEVALSQLNKQYRSIQSDSEQMKALLLKMLSQHESENKEIKGELHALGSSLHHRFDWLASEGISKPQIHTFSVTIKHDLRAMEAIRQIQSNQGDLEAQLELLNPYLQEAFARNFEAKDAKMLRWIASVIKNWVLPDIPGDNMNFEL